MAHLGDLEDEDGDDVSEGDADGDEQDDGEQRVGVEVVVGVLRQLLQGGDGE